MEKLCVFCKNIDMNTSGCYGDYPDPATFSCLKGHWDMDEYEFPDGFRKRILVAENCEDYEQA